MAKRVVLAVGCFDCLHVGHVAHLQAAKKLGTQLVVAVTVDACVDKGPGRPVFGWHQRAQMVEALRCVNRVVPNHLVEDTLRWILPDVYVKGCEYQNALPEAKLCAELNIEVVYLDTWPVYHSSDILSGKLLQARQDEANQRNRAA